MFPSSKLTLNSLIFNGSLVSFSLYKFPKYNRGIIDSECRQKDMQYTLAQAIQCETLP